MSKSVPAKIGAVLYVLWGLLHIMAAYSVYELGLQVSNGMERGRLLQCAFYIFTFATTAIALAIKMNWHNSRSGFWLSALVVGIADVPFILFEIVPGFVPAWPGFVGPAVWVTAMCFTGLGQVRTALIAPV